MPGAFTFPFGPLLQPGMTPEEIKKRQQAMLGGFADFGGATSTIATEMGQPEIAQELQRLQEQDATGSIVGDFANPLGWITGPLADIGSGLKEWATSPSSEPPKAMSQDEFTKDRARAIPTLAEYEEQALAKVRDSEAYKQLLAERRNKAAEGLLTQASKRAKLNYPEDVGRIEGENNALPTAYKTYTSGVNDELESYYGQDFKDRNPGLAKALSAAGPLVAGALTAGTFRKVNKAMSKWGVDAKKAADEGRLADEVKALDGLQWWRDKGATGLSREAQTKAVGAGLSSTIPFDLQLYGDVIDRKGLSPEYQDADGNWQRSRAQQTAEEKLSDPMKYLKENLPTALVSGGVGAAVGSKFGGKSMADEASALLKPSDPQRYADIAKDRVAAVQAQKAIDAAKAAPLPTPPKQTRQPKQAAPGQPPKPTKTETDAEAKRVMEHALNQLKQGKKVSVGRFKSLPPKRLARIEKIIADTRAAASPNMPNNEVADLLRGQVASGAIKPAVVGGATGYSAILAERLAKMEEDKEQEF